MKQLLLLLLISFSTNCLAQDKPQSSLSTLDGIINELLDQVTIEKGEKMDTTAVRNLFYPGAILTVADPSGPESVPLVDFLTLLMDPYYEAGYTEKEIYKVVDEYNGIAQVFQTFYGKDSEGEEGKGINSYQLTFYENRWWIVSLLWTVESETEKIPKKYGGE